MLQRLSDSDWGPEADSGSAIQSDHFPNSAKPSQPHYEVVFVDTEDSGIDGAPFVVDQGAHKIYLADDGAFHAQIMSAIGNHLIGPLCHGYVLVATGQIKFTGRRPVDADLIEKTVSDYMGLSTDYKFGQVEPDPQVCPICDKLRSDCRCLSWGEGADWAQGPIDQSSLREMKPGIQAKVALSSQQKAAAWDKPSDALSPEEMIYVGGRWMPSDYEVQRGQFGNCLEWALAHQQAYPQLAIGMHWFGDENHMEPDHFFTHDDKYAYDTNGVHELPYKAHISVQEVFPDADENDEIDNGTEYNLTPEDAMTYQAPREGRMPSREWILRYAPNPNQPPDVTTPNDYIEDSPELWNERRPWNDEEPNGWSPMSIHVNEDRKAR